MDEEKNIADAVAEHPEGMMQTSEAYYEDGEPWNPRLHVILHAMVLGQLEELAAARETYEELQSKFGLHPHAAIHALGSSTMQEIFKIMKNREECDKSRLKKNLAELLDPDSEAHQMLVKPMQHGKAPVHSGFD